LTLTGVLSQSFSSISPVSSRCFSSMTFRLSDFVPLNDYDYLVGKYLWRSLLKKFVIN
jgi:hypothetical protein